MELGFSASIMQEDLTRPLSERISKNSNLQDEYSSLSETYEKEMLWFWGEGREVLRDAFKEIIGFYRF